MSSLLLHALLLIQAITIILPTVVNSACVENHTFVLQNGICNLNAFTCPDPLSKYNSAVSFNTLLAANSSANYHVLEHFCQANLASTPCSSNISSSSWMLLWPETCACPVCDCASEWQAGQTTHYTFEEKIYSKTCQKRTCITANSTKIGSYYYWGTVSSSTSAPHYDGNSKSETSSVLIYDSLSCPIEAPKCNTSESMTAGVKGFISSDGNCTKWCACSGNSSSDSSSVDYKCFEGHEEMSALRNDSVFFEQFWKTCEYNMQCCRDDPSSWVFQLPIGASYCVCPKCSCNGSASDVEFKIYPETDWYDPSSVDQVCRPCNCVSGFLVSNSFRNVWAYSNASLATCAVGDHLCTSSYYCKYNCKQVVTDTITNSVLNWTIDGLGSTNQVSPVCDNYDLCRLISAEGSWEAMVLGGKVCALVNVTAYNPVYCPTNVSFKEDDFSLVPYTRMRYWSWVEELECCNASVSSLCSDSFIFNQDCSNLNKTTGVAENGGSSSLLLTNFTETLHTCMNSMEYVQGAFGMKEYCDNHGYNDALFYSKYHRCQYWLAQYANDFGCKCKAYSVLFQSPNATLANQNRIDLLKDVWRREMYDLQDATQFCCDHTFRCEFSTGEVDFIWHRAYVSFSLNVSLVTPSSFNEYFLRQKIDSVLDATDDSDIWFESTTWAVGNDSVVVVVNVSVSCASLANASLANLKAGKYYFARNIVVTDVASTVVLADELISGDGYHHGPITTQPTAIPSTAPSNAPSNAPVTTETDDANSLIGLGNLAAAFVCSIILLLF